MRKIGIFVGRILLLTSAVCLIDAQKCDPVALENGTIRLSMNSMRVTFTCKIGFKLLGAIAAECVAGEWNRDIPTCQRIGCETIELENGAVVYLRQKTNAKFRCNTGYKLIGAKDSFCIDNEWNTTVPTCSVIGCPPLPDLKNGKINYQKMTVAKIRCNIGYTLQGPAEVNCVDDAWESTLFSCVENDKSPGRSSGRSAGRGRVGGRNAGGAASPDADQEAALREQILKKIDRVMIVFFKNKNDDKE